MRCSVRVFPVMGAALGALLLTGCGGASHAASSAAASSSPSAPRRAQEFLALVAPLDAAIGRANERISALGPTTDARYAALAAPVIPALQTFDTRLRQLGASGQTAEDIGQLVTADQVLITTLRNAGHEDPATWRQAVGSDLAYCSVRDTAVRTDLGLPPAPGAHTTSAPQTT